MLIYTLLLPLLLPFTTFASSSSSFPSFPSSSSSCNPLPPHHPHHLCSSFFLSPPKLLLLPPRLLPPQLLSSKLSIPNNSRSYPNLQRGIFTYIEISPKSFTKIAGGAALRMIWNVPIISSKRKLNMIIGRFTA